VHIKLRIVQQLLLQREVQEERHGLVQKVYRRRYEFFQGERVGSVPCGFSLNVMV
jgi:hypothetical protein